MDQNEEIFFAIVSLSPYYSAVNCTSNGICDIFCLDFQSLPKYHSNNGTFVLLYAQMINFNEIHSFIKMRRISTTHHRKIFEKDKRNTSYEIFNGKHVWTSYTMMEYLFNINNDEHFGVNQIVMNFQLFKYSKRIL